MKKKFLSFLLAAGMVFFAAGHARANQAVIQAADNYFAEKTLMSGTLDIYDQTINAVRNLRRIDSESSSELVDGKYVVKQTFQDIVRGTKITVGAIVADEGGDFSIEKLEILDRKELQPEGEVKSEFMDAEVQQVMRDYVDSQAKFTGSVSLYDEDKQILRQLKLLVLKEEVRRLGKYYISRAEFEDLDSGEILGIDITAEDNKKGALEIQSLRIRETRKPVKK